MNFIVSDLARDIRIALDSNNVSTQLFDISDVDTLTLEEIIRSKIADAVRLVELNAPYHLLDGGTVFPSASEVITWESQPGYGPGSVILPEDFLRLVCFKMTDWERTVYEPIDETSPLYSVQRSRFGGVRGNPQKPVVAIVNRSTGLNLEFYSCNSNPAASVAMASYIKVPAFFQEQQESGIYVEKIAICEKLKPAVVYYAAYLVAQSIGEGDKAAALLNASNSLMQ